MRLIVTLSAVAMIGLSSSAMGLETAPAQVFTEDVSLSLQSLEVRPTAKLNVSDASVVRGGRSGGFFGQLMEIERRKNAWFRRTFSR